MRAAAGWAMLQHLSTQRVNLAEADNSRRVFR
jgi:hypothetical protein